MVIGLGIVFAATVLFVNSFSDDEFTFGKGNFFQTGMLILLPVMASCLSLSSIKSLFNRARFLSFLMIAYAISAGISTLFSVSPFVSFWGSDRRYGLVLLLFLVIFFFAVLFFVRTREVIIAFFLTISSVSAIVSVIGILEFFKIRLWNLPVYDQGIASTLGHPSFLGAYLVMVIPVSIATFILTRRRLTKSAIFISIIFQILALGLTKTRATILALPVAVFLALLLALLKRGKRGWLLAIFVIMVVVTLGIVVFGFPSNILSLGTGSAGLRMLWWEEALQAVQERPWFGYGLDLQGNILPRFYHPLEGVWGNYFERADRAHNEIFDQLLTLGIVGTGVFFTLIVGVIAMGVRRFLVPRDRQESVIILALLAGVIAYMIQGMFSFSVTALSVTFWIFLALLASIVSQREAAENDLDTRVTSIRKIEVITITIVSIFLGWFLIARPVIAGRFMVELIALDPSDRFAFYKARDLHETILKYGQRTSGEIAYRHRFVRILLQIAEHEKRVDQREKILTLAEEELNEIRRKNHEDFDYYPVFAELHSEWSIIDPTKISAMNDVFQRSVDQSPRFAPFYALWGRELMKIGKLKEAKEKLIHAAVLFVPPDDFQGTERFYSKAAIAQVYQDLAEVESKLSNGRNAEIYRQKSEQYRKN